MIKSCRLEEGSLRQLAGHQTFIQLLDPLSTRQTNLGDRIIIRNILMGLVVEEITMGRGTKMVPIGMKGIPATNKTLETSTSQER